jgi:hypothetical protein
LQFIKNRFEAKGLVSDEGDSDEQVQEILTCLDAFKIRLEAEFARIRIEKRAFGTGIADYLTNVLSEEANTLDEQAGKCNHNKRG